MTSAETFSAPPLECDTSVDLAVIGGGFTGCSAALEAARAGASVVLLEAETIGHGGSGRNVGLVNAGLWLPPEKLIAQMGRAAGLRLIEALGKAPDLVFELIARERIDCEAQRNGTLHLAHSAAGLRDLEDRHRQGVALDAPLRLLDATETAQRTGSQAFHGALFDPRAGTIQPLAYVQGLARAAQAAGAALHERSPVTALSFGKDSWGLETGSHRVKALHVLVATNAYHLGISDPFQPQFVPVNFCQYATAPLPEEPGESILSGGEGCWDTGLVMSSLRRDFAGRMIIGGIGDGDGSARGLHAAWAARKLAALFPALRGQEFTHGWSGRIAMTRDHIPKIVAFGPRALASFGYSGRGIAPGSLFGRECARALLGGDSTTLPVQPVETYSEAFKSARALWYEFGASVVHAASARL